MRIEILGKTRIVADGTTRPLPKGREGLLLQRLLLKPNETVDADTLIDALWPGVDPAVGGGRLRVTATRLRRRLAGEVGLEAAPGGYRLSIPETSLDLLEFETLAQDAETGDLDAAQRALALWRGEPYLGFVASRALRRQRRRLLAVRTHLQEMVSGQGATSMAPASFAPPVESAIRRPRLLDQLPRLGGARLVALIAPTGYGKSVLLSQWADRQRGRVGWRRLTTADNDPATFWRGVAGALGVGTDEAVDLDDTETWIVSHLVNQLVDLDRPVGVVLDDFHVITNPVVHSQFHRFLRRGPEPVTLAIGSRLSLPFPIGRLQAAGEMVALTAADLRFTSGEATEALTATGDGWCDGGRAHQLHQISDGWPLAATEMASAMQAATATSFDDRLLDTVADDMLQGILDDLPEDLTDFLMAIAHLDHLDPAICEAVSGRSDSASMLDRLATHHHLIVEVAGGHRHQPLLARMLRRRLSHGDAETAAARHERAAQWYLDNDRPDDALAHTAAAGNTELIAASLRPAMERVTARADGAMLRRWVASVDLPTQWSESVEIAMLASALLSDDERGRWFPNGHDMAGGEMVGAVTDAVDLLRDGRCAAALDAADRGRRLVARRRQPIGSEAAEVASTLLSVTETDCRILLGGLPDDGDRRLPNEVAAPWPWLALWAVGQRALFAYVAGDSKTAKALVEYAEIRCRGLHPSWQLLGDGSACLTKALLQADAPGADSESAIEAIEEIVHRTDDLRRRPKGIIARYALHRAHRRAGQTEAAEARLAEADAAAQRHPELVFLAMARARFCETAAEPTTPAGWDLLTPQERAVLGHLATDLTLSEIAAEMYLSPNTVKSHTRSLYRKLGVRRRSEAAEAIEGLRGP